MALKEQLITIPLGGSPDEGGGVNEGVDSKLINAPYLLELKNGELGKDGSVRRRRPANELPDTGISDRAKQNLNSVFTHNNSSLVVNTATGPHVYTSGTGWADTGEFGQVPCNVSEQNAISTKNWYTDSAVSDGVVMYVGTDDDGLWASAYEVSTGALVLPRKVLDTNVTNPKVIAHPSTGLFHVGHMTSDASASVVVRSYDAASFPSTAAVHSVTAHTLSDQYELALGAVGFFYTAAGLDSHTLQVNRYDESSYVLSGTQTVATVGASGGIGAWYNATNSTIYAVGFDAAVDSSAAKTAYFPAALTSQSAGSDFTLAPSTYADVGVAGFVASFAYSGNGDAQMLMVLSTICYYNVPGTSPSPPNYQSEGALGQHGCTECHVIGATMTNISTVKPAWNYYLSTRAWNPTGTNASRPWFGLLRLNTSAHQDGGGLASSFFYEQQQSIQGTLLVCSIGQHASADPEGYTRCVSVVARAHDNVAASPESYDIAESAYPFVSTPYYHSRLACVSAYNSNEYLFSRAVYSSYQVRDTTQPPTSIYDGIFSGIVGVYGQVRQSSVSAVVSPCRKGETSQTSLVSSGYIGAFDGTSTYEVVPHSYPEVVDRPFVNIDVSGVGDVAIPFFFNATDITGGIVDVNYALNPRMLVRFVWAWVDAYGNLHRSAPSQPHNSNAMRYITRTDGQGIYSVDMYVTDLPLSAVPSTNEARYIEVYVTGDSSVDPSYHLAATLPYEPFSGGQTERDSDRPWLLRLVPVLKELNEDGSSPYDDRELLYTDGDVLENQPPPALLDVVATSDRVWGITANEAWPSKLLEPGIAPEWNGNLVIPMLTGPGPCVAIAALDEKVVIFKQNSIFVITGDGPNNAGGGNAFGVPQAISTDIGCVSRASVVRGPFGLAFQSPRGLYLLDRGLNLTWIGKAVEDTVGSAPVVCGVVVPEQSHVRWILDSTGKAVVWNYDMKQWGVYDGSKEKHGTVYGGSWVGLLDALQLEDLSYAYFAQERPTAPNEGSNYIQAPMPVSFTTAWIKPGGIQGFVRLRRACVLCEIGTIPSFFNAHNGLQVEAQYNYDPTTLTTYAWDEAGTNVTWPQYEMHLQHQKFESIRFVVSEVPVGGVLTCPGTVFSGMTLRVAVKGTQFKYFRQGDVR